MIGVSVNDPVAQLANFVKFQELLINGAESIEAGERVVAGKVGGPCPGDEVAESLWKWLDLPGSAEEMIVQESHDSGHVASNEEVATKAKRGDARKDFHGTYGGTAEAASDPTNREVLNARHMFEILEGASPVERVPKQQPIGKYRDHAGIPCPLLLGSHPQYSVCVIRPGRHHGCPRVPEYLVCLLERHSCF